jgi:hypothetical protein
VMSLPPRDWLGRGRQHACIRLTQKYVAANNHAPHTVSTGKYSQK